MSSTWNPLSVPGGWNKDKDQPASEVEGQDVPRSAVGTVSETGDIVDETGKSVGKIADSKDPGELVGNTVNSAGEIVGSTGDVLSKATLDNDLLKQVPLVGGGNSEEKEGGEEEYTTSRKEGDESEATATEKDEQGGGGLLGSTTKTVGNTVKGVSGVTSGLGLGGGSGSNEEATGDATDQVNEATGEAPGTDAAEGAKDKVEGAAEGATEGEENAAPVNLEDNDKTEGVTDEAKDKIPEAGEGTVEVPEEGKDVADEAKDKVPEEGKDVEVPEEGQEKLDEAGNKVDEAGNKIDEAAPEGEVPEEAKEGVEGAQEGVEGAKEDAEGAAEAAEEEAPIDFTVLKGLTVNKAGNLVNKDGSVIGRIKEGDIKQLVGKKADEEGNIWNDSGKIIGKAEPIPENEREDAKDAGPFENYPDAVVEPDGKVTSEGRQVGELVEGDPKKLRGSKVDADGDVLDKNGNVIGKAEAWNEPEPVPEEEPEKIDMSILAGKRVNKAGNVCDSNGVMYGRLVEGNAASCNGRMCDKDGNVRSETGDIIGRAELVPESERESGKDGPFAELKGLTVGKDGKIYTPSGDVVGRLVEGDAAKLAGRAVDENGEISDKNGNTLGRAERWEEPEVEKKKGPMAGRKVNKDGNVVDEDGNIMGKLISGDPTACIGKEIDDDGDVLNSKGTTIGHVALLEDIPPEAEPEESAEDKEKREKAEKDKELAGNLASTVQDALDKVRPICKRIDAKVNKIDNTPKEEWTEEKQDELVKELKPMLEEGGRILTETNGIIRGMDPDGRIQRNAKHKSGTKEASAEEHHLAEVLKELTGTVSETIENGKRKVENMPKAKKELNPLWGLLTEPLGQILAAVGLLLNGVLGLVGRLLSGLGLGGILDNLLGGLGLTKVLEGLGLGSVTSSLTGKKK